MLPVLRSVAINGAWEALLVGRPRHEDGGGSGRPPLDAISLSVPASGDLALLGFFGFRFRTEETLALRRLVAGQFNLFLLDRFALGLVQPHQKGMNSSSAH